MFKYFITSKYLYTDTLDQLYQNKLEIDVDKNYFKYFDNLAIESLSDLLRLTGNDPYTYQYTPKEHDDYVIWREEKAKQTTIMQFTKNSSYLLYTNFTPDTYDYLLSKIDFINQFDTLVIDLQGNGGGDLDVLFDLCGLFVGNDQTITIESTRTFDKCITSSLKQQIFVDNIYILIDNHSASASESFVVCLNDLLPNVTIVGTTSYGKGIGQTKINLTKGFYTKATTLEWLSPNGYSIHHIGITPDYYYDKEDILDYVKYGLLE
ncbi:MAG: hypothetical protein KAG94_00910 [Clostridiales bacterium]|nr:hypothetical protein [Clostridiales bacterium]